MKLKASQLPLGKPQTRRKTPKIAPLIALTIFLTIPLYFPFFRDKKLSQTSHSYESLEDSNSIIPISHLEYPPPTESNIKKGEKHDSQQCNDGGGGDTVLHRHDMAHGKKHEKGRRKKTRRAQTDHIVISPKETSSPQERIKQTYDRGSIRSKVLDGKCDLFSGEWVPNPEAPYYTNATCDAIQEHQNCMKFGRPDLGFLKWRWKPDDCGLPIFDPYKFLELVKGKSLAFVGDSVARNHMQSLICLLSRVAYPIDFSDPTDQNKRYEYKEHDFNISMFWAPYLVRTGKLDPNNEKRPFNLYLDEYDQHWTTKIALFDYVIISAGHWFARPTYFYLNNRLVGCLYCPEPNVSHMTSVFSYRRAFRTALRAINGAVKFNGVTFLRTFAPSHFEGGPWDKGGDCVRTRPFKRNQTVLKDYNLEMYLIQLEELRIAQRAGRRNGGKFRLFDATKPMLLRPDGHPSKYGRLGGVNQTFANDCVHWCLPDHPPNPNNQSPDKKIHAWQRRSHTDGDGAAAKNPPPTAAKPEIAVNKTIVKKPEYGEGKSPSPARTDISITKEYLRSEALNEKKCDLFTGEWVPNPEGPYYTHTSCDAIQEHQNCMKFGRPDLGFLKWRWKPDDCELPIFDPYKFLELVRGKSLAFVGDSVARNHMQSLICLLSRVAHPVDVAKPNDENRLYEYREYDFNISIISSPYLIRTQRTDPNDFTRPYNLYLDEFDDTWTARIESFDYIIISAGQWFFRPTYFYLNRTLTGCLYCPESNVTHLTSSFSYRWAFQTAFRAINGAANFNGVAFLRTFAPSHFEGGPWDKGGDCVRTRPFKRNETVLEEFSLEMYKIQLEELRIAQRAGRRTGGKLRVFDATKAMLLRPDGHPSKYGHLAGANQTIPNDCVHWCLPGPIDSWNDFLQELLKREVGAGDEL
ncbi:hypothetical protein BUALT_Bualt04G0128400 [Buddleja alternifolia]|uniref:Trichome birefringence-like N-terminal domain-containing protein n=1 Tax=Buddleja alternifolia TaxID=168488 RepID=A0AAV6XNI4_9LAMI|nr:hypothetical protein BUALT_Bualt04G0128400 [Buddleja alternifolia]